MWFKFWLVTSLTTVRGLSAPFIVWFLAGDVSSLTVAFVAFAVAAACDFDGSLARYWSVTTKFGAFMDPFMDKILLLTVLFGVAIWGGIFTNASVTWIVFWILPTVVIVVRECWALVLSLWNLKIDLNRGIVALNQLFVFGDSDAHTRPPTTMASKIKMGIQCLAVGGFIFADLISAVEVVELEVLILPLWVLSMVIYWVAGLLTFFTGLDHIRNVYPSTHPMITEFFARCKVSTFI